MKQGSFKFSLTLLHFVTHLKLCTSKFWSVKGKPLIFLPPGETGSSWDGVHWGQEQCGLVQPGEQNLLLTFNFVQPCEPNLPLTQPLASCLQMKIFQSKFQATMTIQCSDRFTMATAFRHHSRISTQFHTWVPDKVNLWKRFPTH